MIVIESGDVGRGNECRELPVRGIDLAEFVIVIESEDVESRTNVKSCRSEVLNWQNL